MLFFRGSNIYYFGKWIYESEKEENSNEIGSAHTAVKLQLNIQSLN
jgi:hypothetical protein